MEEPGKATFVVSCLGSHAPSCTENLPNDVLKFGKAIDVVPLFHSSKSGIFLGSVGDLTELKDVLSFLASVDEALKLGTFRVLLFNLLEEAPVREKVDSIFQSKNGVELLSETLSRNGLAQKIESTAQIIELLLRKSQSLSSPTLEGVRWIPALNLAHDFWLIQPKAGRFAAGVWSIEVSGPGPSAGKWEHEGKSWVWHPKTSFEKDLDLEVSEGRWYFSGRMPEFSPSTNLWRFTGENPELFFRKSDGSLFRRIYREGEGLHKGVLVLAHNSQFAKEKWPLIKKTFSDSVVVKKEVLKPEAASAEWIFEADDLFAEGTKKKGVSRFPGGVEAFSTMSLTLDLLLHPEGKTYSICPAEVVECNDTSLLLDVPQVPLRKSQGLEVVLRITGRQPVRLVGTVLSIVALEGERLFVTLQFSPGSQNLLQEIQSLYDQRQQEVLDFFRESKGL